MQVDVRSRESIEAALDDVALVVMCIEPRNVDVAEACSKRGIHYVDITASSDIVAALECIEFPNSSRVLNVGVAPGSPICLRTHSVTVTSNSR